VTETSAPRSHAMAEQDALPVPALAARGTVGGALMGLANLVPGISGGTMLLAAGVYPSFIGAIAEVTTLKFRKRSLLTLAVIGGAAVLAILLLAGTMRSLVIDHRWAMYSLFIGLTLGGVPLVWRLAGKPTPSLWAAVVVSFLLMSLMALVGTGASSGEASAPLLVLAGLAGASAMILPGVSGSYLLVLLGQYEPILGAIDLLKGGLLGVDGGGFDLAMVLQSMEVVIPVGIGVVLGIVAVSNLLKWLLEHFEKATLGALLGLLLGAVVGLYPFQAAVQPEAGYIHRGMMLDAVEAAALEPEDWPVEPYAPTGGQAAGAVALLLLGLGATLIVDRIGSGAAERRRPSAP